MLSHAMPETLIFGLGASTWPKASEPWAEEGAGFQFGCWHLAQSLRAPGQGWGAGSGPPSPAQGSEAPGQNYKIIKCPRANYGSRSYKIIN